VSWKGGEAAVVWGMEHRQGKQAGVQHTGEAALVLNHFTEGYTVRESFFRIKFDPSKSLTICFLVSFGSKSYIKFRIK